MCSPGWASGSWQVSLGGAHQHPSKPEILAHLLSRAALLLAATRVLCTNSGFAFPASPPNSLGISSVPGRKGWVLGTSLRMWRRRKRNLHEALDGAASTQTPSAPYSGIFALGGYSFQEVSAQTLVVQRQIGASGPTLEKNEESSSG